MKYAARINSFISQGYTLEETFNVLKDTEHLNYVDLNYPEHFKGYTNNEMRELLKENDLKLNAINLRFRDQFINGDLGNIDPIIHEKALQISHEAIEVCSELGGEQVIFWLGHDGNDYTLQSNYIFQWDQIVSAIRELPQLEDIKVSIEYKPYEERAIALIDAFGTSLLMAKEINDDIGVTLDVCHSLMKAENPAFIAQKLLEEGKLYNLHLNDGYGRSDDGLMVGSVHPWIMLEIMYYLKKYDFDGVVYFDTFPQREDAKRELETNISMCKTLEAIINDYGISYFDELVRKNDPISSMEFFIQLLKGKNQNEK